MAAIFGLLAAACGTPQQLGSEQYGVSTPAPVAPSTKSEPSTLLEPVRPVIQATLPLDRSDLSLEIAQSARAVPGVAAVTRVGLAWGETESDAGASGISLVAVDPTDFRALAPARTSAADFVWRSLRGRQIFLAHEEYRRLGVEPGQNIKIKGPGSSSLFRVGGVAANGYPNLGGGLISLQQGQALGITAPGLLLIGVKDESQRTEIQDELQRRIPTVLFEPTAAASRRAFLGGEEAEKLLGTFDYTVNPDGSIVPDQSWVKKFITSKKVPIYGTVRCHKVLFPQLIGALTEIEQAGLAGLIDTRDYGGCYHARLIIGEDPADPNAALSMHAWGLALDVNVSTNQLWAVPTQDPRIVSTFERWGFRWGGRWFRPDGMHFELAALIRS